MKTVITAILLLLLAMTASATVPADKMVVKEEAVRQVVSDYLRSRTANLGVDVTIKKIGYSGDLVLHKGDVTYEVVAPRQWEGWGSANLALIVRVNDHVERNLGVRVEVEALAEMVVAVRHLERGEVVGPTDVALQKRDLSQAPGRICRSLDEVVGKRMKAAVRGNTPLRADYVEKVPLVKSGQMVTIVLDSDALRLTATGRAKNAGAEGDLVMVQNSTSQKEIPARVVDANTVRVDF